MKESRLLRLLSLLQMGREWPGRELAARLGVSLRTIRRDVDRLRDLGYPVLATMGAIGGYRLVAGAAMPPLLLDDEEAVAIAVGLRTAAQQPVDGIDDASVRALGKLDQVLPSRLRHRVASLGAATVPMVGDGRPNVDPDTLTVVAAAITGSEKLRFAYQTAARHVEPHRLVAAGRRWYLVAFDLDRADWRIFRVDRIAKPARTGVRVPARELPGGDAAAFVTQRLYSLFPTYQAVVTFAVPAEQAPAWFGTVEPIDAGHCRLTSAADTLEWLALRLVTIGCDFEVHQPPELQVYLRELAERVTRAVG
jgi:predicted DNA-binding transcriptional regulator YafY